ncbi:MULTISPECIES: MFS transporter [unclassified Leucobacter]|uniref:CynX/NimT family MFS transporter n=1 Tax=unclassified Leucobacter TaxID=2621730 RepID=UPI001F52D6CB|nr:MULTISPECIES: MFS transporter [unclassified Leucobacter]
MRTSEIPIIDDLPVEAERPVDRSTEHPAERSRSRGGMLLLAAGLILIGLNLRIGVASIGPVLGEIRDALGLSTTAAGLLTTIPVFAFGAFAFLTPGLTRRLGMHRLLGITMIVLAAGILLRLHPSLVGLFVGTVLVGAAIAVGNVLMPPAIKQDFSHRAGLMMGLYSTALFVGAAAASGLTVPLLPLVGGGWRAALAVWAAPAILAAVIWIPQMRRSPGRSRAGAGVADAPSEAGEPPFRAILGDPIAIAVTALMGLQSAAYYTSLTWVPTILQDAGIAAGTAGWLFAFSAFPGILASFVVPALAKRIRPLWLPVAVAVALMAVAYIGLAVAPAAAPYLWMTLLGLGQGASISLSLAYIVLRSPDAHHTGHLSTMAQGFGYLIAGLAPIGFGAVHALSGEWTLPLAALGLLLVLQLVAGVVASRPGHIRARIPGRAAR